MQPGPAARDLDPAGSEPHPKTETLSEANPKGLPDGSLLATRFSRSIRRGPKSSRPRHPRTERHIAAVERSKQAKILCLRVEARNRRDPSSVLPVTSMHPET